MDRLRQAPSVASGGVRPARGHPALSAPQTAPSCSRRRSACDRVLVAGFARCLVQRPAGSPGHPGAHAGSPTAQSSALPARHPDAQRTPTTSQTTRSTSCCWGGSPASPARRWPRSATISLVRERRSRPRRRLYELGRIGAGDARSSSGIIPAALMVAVGGLAWLTATTRRLVLAALLGLALAALVLTKVVFSYLWIPIALALGATDLLRRSLDWRTAGLVGVVLIVQCIPVVGWMTRNYLASGDFSIVDARSGDVLARRVSFNTMRHDEWVAGFAYYLPSSGGSWWLEGTPREPFERFRQTAHGFSCGSTGALRRRRSSNFGRMPSARARLRGWRWPGTSDVAAPRRARPARGAGPERGQRPDPAQHVYADTRGVYRARTCLCWTATAASCFKAEVVRTNSATAPRATTRASTSLTNRAPDASASSMNGSTAPAVRHRRTASRKLLDGLQALDRTSCCRFWANQLRGLLTAAAYVLMQVNSGCARRAPPVPAPR